MASTNREAMTAPKPSAGAIEAARMLVYDAMRALRPTTMAQNSENEAPSEEEYCEAFAAFLLAHGVWFPEARDAGQAGEKKSDAGYPPQIAMEQRRYLGVVEGGPSAQTSESATAASSVSSARPAAEPGLRAAAQRVIAAWDAAARRACRPRGAEPMKADAEQFPYNWLYPDGSPAWAHISASELAYWCRTGTWPPPDRWKFQEPK